MSRSRNRRRPAVSAPSALDLARDELFQHVIRCDVIGADPVHQAEWFGETMAYMAERWHELSPKELIELRTLGERFAKPARSTAAPEATPAPADAPAADATVAESSDADSGSDSGSESDAESETDVASLDTVSAA